MLHQATLIFALGLTASEPASAPASVPAKAAAPAPAGKAARPSTLTHVTDKTYAQQVLAPHKGKLVVVNLWGSFCAPCLDEIPMLKRVLSPADPAGKDAALLFVSVDGTATEADARAVLEKRNLGIDSFLVANADPEPFILAVDPSWAGQVPYTVFYGPDGTRLFGIDGEQTEPELRAALAKARAIAKGK